MSYYVVCWQAGFSAVPAVFLVTIHINYGQERFPNLWTNQFVTRPQSHGWATNDENIAYDLATLPSRNCRDIKLIPAQQSLLLIQN